MELLTSEFSVFCDTYQTKATVNQHEVNGKKKVELTLSDSQGEKKLSLWSEDADALAGFLFRIAAKSDNRL